MNKILQKYLIITFLLTFAVSVFASTNDTLSKIENDLFGFSYTNDKSVNRVERLEKRIYGKVSAGDINKRITKLSKDISADVIGLEITPSRDTFLAEEQEKEDSSVNYPIVDEIEKKLFNTTYKNRDFHTRIVTIEKKLFGKIYDVDDYSKRMDRIKASVYPDSVASNNEHEYYDTEYYYDKAINSSEL